MLTRDKFLKSFNYVSNCSAKKISIYYALGSGESLGISYFELHRVSNELGVYFLNIFGEYPQYIGVSVTDYFLLPSIILGIWESGCCIAGVADQYSKQDTLHFLDFLAVKYLITDTKNNDYEGKLVSKFVIHHQEFFIWCRQNLPVIELNVKDICCGVMTSGSTGEPKIIQVPWSCILANAVELSDEFQVTEDDCVFQASPYSFDPFFIEIFLVLMNGCSLAIVPKARKLCPSDLLKLLFNTSESNTDDLPASSFVALKCENYFCVNTQKLRTKKVSILQMTPSVFKRWTDTQIESFILSPDSPLRILVLGGEKFPSEILKLKHKDNSCRIFNIYGITEISCWAFLNEVTSHPTDTRISIGKPLKDIKYTISETGEFEIGSSIRVCFINKEKISPSENPVFRKTGDIVKLENSQIYYVSRSHEIVKKYGMKINLSKIEELFVSHNKQIKECYCVFNEKSFKLGLFYVPVNCEVPDVNYKLLSTEEFLEGNYIIPTDKLKNIEKPDYLIEITKPPLNPHGKCSKNELLQYLEGIKTVTPELKLKNIFRRVWADVLGLNKVGSFSSNFVGLGGNSVSAINLINQLEELGIGVPQTFIIELLSGKTFDECLKRLSLEETTVSKKKIKFNTEVSGAGLSVRWKFHLGKCVDATPAVFNYEGEKRIVIGSHFSQLSCINPEFGSEIWTIYLGGRIESGFKPTQDGSKGFVGCYDHYVYCVGTSDGRIIWKFRTGDMVKSTPCLSSDEQVVYVGSYDKNLYALSTSEGQLIKSLKLSNGGIFSSGTLCDWLHSFYIGTLDGTCVALDEKTNELTWKISLESPVFASPCLIPNKSQILFAEVLGNVHLINALNGVTMWAFKANGNIYSSPNAVELNHVNYIIFGCHDAHLYCLRYDSEPELKWKQQLDSSVFAKPSIIKEFSIICVPTTKGFIRLCDLDLGTVKAQLKLDGEVFSSAVYFNDRLYVGCRDNNIYCIDISEAKELS